MKRCSNSLTIKETGIKTRQNQYIHNGWAIIRRLDNAKENVNSCFLEHRQIQPLWTAAQQESVKLSMRKTQQSYSWYFPKSPSIHREQIRGCLQKWQVADNLGKWQSQMCRMLMQNTTGWQPDLPLCCSTVRTEY